MPEYIPIDATCDVCGKPATSRVEFTLCESSVEGAGAKQMSYKHCSGPECLTEMIRRVWPAGTQNLAQASVPKRGKRNA